jgi:hypothetical protein
VSRRLALRAALLVAVLLGGTTAGCSSSVSPALEVGGTRISNDDFLDEVEEWAGNPSAVNPDDLADQPPGTFPQQLVAQVLQQRIELELHNLEFEELGLEIDDELRQEALIGLFGDAATAEEALGGFSDAFATSYLDDEVRRNAVQTALGPDYPTWRDEAVRTTDISVNSRYGTWDADTATVVAPEGPIDPSAVTDLELGS